MSVYAATSHVWIVISSPFFCNAFSRMLSSLGCLPLVVCMRWAVTIRHQPTCREAYPRPAAFGMSNHDRLKRTGAPTKAVGIPTQKPLLMDERRRDARLFTVHRQGLQYCRHRCVCKRVPPTEPHAEVLTPYGPRLRDEHLPCPARTLPLAFWEQVGSEAGLRRHSAPDPYLYTIGAPTLQCRKALE